MQPPPRSVEYSKLKSCIKSWEQTTWSASCLGYAIYFIWREFLFLLVQRHLAMNANVKGIPGNPLFGGTNSMNMEQASGEPANVEYVFFPRCFSDLRAIKVNLIKWFLAFAEYLWGQDFNVSQKVMANVLEILLSSRS